jgi:hypothetical protein
MLNALTFTGTDRNGKLFSASPSVHRHNLDPAVMALWLSNGFPTLGLYTKNDAKHAIAIVGVAIQQNGIVSFTMRMTLGRWITRVIC